MVESSVPQNFPANPPFSNHFPNNKKYLVDSFVVFPPLSVLAIQRISLILHSRHFSFVVSNSLLFFVVFNPPHTTSTSCALSAFHRSETSCDAWCRGRNLQPQSAVATSESRAYFAANYRIAQKTLAAAHGSPTDRQKATGREVHTQESSQHKAVDERG